MQLQNRTALVTGAASGIGRSIAIALAKRGCHLALADVDMAGLSTTAKAVGERVVVTEHRLDVSDPSAVAAFPERIRASHLGLDLLVNNAGVAVGGAFEEIAEADFDWLLSINLWGVVNMTRAFLPLLRESPDARLVNMSSVFGLVAPPGQSAYVTSKFAVRGFSESLRHELAGSSVGVTVVHPGGVKTAIARNARLPNAAGGLAIEQQAAAFESKLRLSSDVAAERIVRAIEARKPRVIVGADARIAAAAERLAPVSYWRLLSGMVGA